MGLGAVIQVGGSVDETLAPMEIEVVERIGRAASYRLRFGVDITEGDLPQLADARLDPGCDLVVLTALDGAAQCLVRGPVHGQRATLVHGGAGSFVDVLGGDASVEMDREERARQWLDVTDADVVASILGEYGVATDVAATAASHAEARHSLVQRGTDLELLRRLARRNGCLFWLDWDAEGNATAHFRPPPLDGEAAAELAMNLDRPAFQRLEIEWDSERPVSVQALQGDLGAAGEIDGSAHSAALRPLGVSDLAAVAPGIQAMILTAAVDDAADLAARSAAVLTEASFFLRASGTTTTDAAGAILRAHRLVTLSGVGARHGGLWLCAGVRHLIAADGHSMDVELVRNGWGAA